MPGFEINLSRKTGIFNFKNFAKLRKKNEIHQTDSEIGVVTNSMLCWIMFDCGIRYCFYKLNCKSVKNNFLFNETSNGKQ